MTVFWEHMPSRLQGIRFGNQEGQASSAATKLKAMISITTTVIRGGQSMEVAISQLVRGDVVSLAAGDMVPANLRIVAAKDLHVTQSSLTGESLPDSDGHPIHHSHKQDPVSAKLTMMTAACDVVTIITIGIAILFTVPGDDLGFIPLPPLYWPLLELTLPGYVVLTQTMNSWLLRTLWI